MEKESATLSIWSSAGGCPKTTRLKQEGVWKKRIILQNQGVLSIIPDWRQKVQSSPSIVPLPFLFPVPLDNNNDTSEWAVWAVSLEENVSAIIDNALSTLYTVQYRVKGREPVDSWMEAVEQPSLTDAWSLWTAQDPWFVTLLLLHPLTAGAVPAVGVW